MRNIEEHERYWTPKRLAVLALHALFIYPLAALGVVALLFVVYVRIGA